MASLVVDPTQLLTGPGVVYWAPLGSAAPSHTVGGSKFTDLWTAVAWKAVGATDTGFQFSNQLATNDITVAESIDVQMRVITGRTAGAAFTMSYINLSALNVAMNGGTTTTVSGTTATTLTKFAPPTASQVLRRMIGWESDDATVRFVAYQCLNTADVQFQSQKTDKAGLPTGWQLEVPSGGGDVWNIWTAGTGRL